MSVEQIYNELAINACVAKVQAGRISNYTRAMYAACRDRLPNDIGLIDFASRISNWNPNKGGIGQKSQIRALREFDNQISELKNSRDTAIRLTRSRDGVTRIVRSANPSTIKGIKTFDAIREYEDFVRLFVLKTVDLGAFSRNRGGGHQDNVSAEIDIIAENVRGKRLVFNGKRVEVVVLVDGRSDIVARYANYNSDNFVVSSVDAFCEQ